MGRKNTTVNATDILTFVRSRSEWAMRATSVANPERVATLTPEGMFTSDNTKLRAYVNAAGVATLETNAEYSVRKGIKRDAKLARKSPATPTPASKPASKSTTIPDTSAVDALQAQLAALQAQLAALTGQDVTPVALVAPVANVKRSTVSKSPRKTATPATPEYTDSATKNATLQAIDRKLATLGKDRAWLVERLPVGTDLLNASVRDLRSWNGQLGDRIMSEAKKSK